MKSFESTFVAAARVRRVLVEDGDIRAEIEFQNDINAILAGIEDGSSALETTGGASQPQTDDTLSTTAAVVRRAGLRGARLGPGRRAVLTREPGMPYISIAMSDTRGA